MNNIKQFWNQLSLASRIAFAAAAAAVVLGTAVVGCWLLRTDYQTLFADLAPRDSAAMVAELERMKVPYRLDDGGNTILVPADDVHRTRLKLLSTDVPLQGAVGFELFNNNDVGMTDFAQKVNYQRALQGELTRTILSLEEVQSVRVHLALPEQGLYRKPGVAGKASVTLALKPGRSIGREQVRGVQRLVAAAVPDVKPDDVTVIDQQGKALTREAGDTADESTMTGSIDTRRELEDYLGRKATEVLDETFGVGEAVAKVDVRLSHEQQRVTTESVLPATSASNRAAGVVVRELESNAHDGADAAADAASGAPSRSRDIQYQVGRRVEQMTSAPGAVERLDVAVIVKKSIDAAQSERLKDLVAMAVGLNKSRGDGIAVYGVDQLGAPALGGVLLPATQSASHDDHPQVFNGTQTPRRGSGAINDVFLVAFASALGLAALVWLSRRGKGLGLASPGRRLSQSERRQVMTDVQEWLGASAARSEEARR